MPKDATCELRVERPYVHRQLRVLIRDERTNFENEHGLAERLNLQIEDQRCTVPVCPHPRYLRIGPALSQEPSAVLSPAEHNRLSRVHRAVNLAKGQRAHIQTQRPHIP